MLLPPEMQKTNGNEQINQISILRETQKAKENEQINQILNNYNEKLRSNFTSDENFRQFQLLRSDHSDENILLTIKFINAAADNNTITSEEYNIFRKYIDRTNITSMLALERHKYCFESMCDEAILELSKYSEINAAGLKEIQELREKWELEYKRDEEKSWINWFSSMIKKNMRNLCFLFVVYFSLILILLIMISVGKNK